MCVNWQFSRYNVALSSLHNDCAMQSLGLALHTASFGPPGETFHNISVPSPQLAENIPYRRLDDENVTTVWHDVITLKPEPL